MMLPVGLWAFVLGYALVYTGVSNFTGNGVSLAASLGLGANPLQTALPASTPTASSSTSSSLNGGIVAPAPLPT